jgi:hypothetical protein
MVEGVAEDHECGLLGDELVSLGSAIRVTRSCGPYSGSGCASSRQAARRSGFDQTRCVGCSGSCDDIGATRRHGGRVCCEAVVPMGSIAPMHERESDAASIDELAARINADAARVAALMDERRGAPASCSPSPALRSSRMWRRSNPGRRQVGHTDTTLTLRIYQAAAQAQTARGVPRARQRASRHLAGRAVSAAGGAGGRSWAQIRAQLAAGDGLTGYKVSRPVEKWTSCAG